jgi:uncharacterized membrane protein
MWGERVAGWIGGAIMAVVVVWFVLRFIVGPILYADSYSCVPDPWGQSASCEVAP